MFGALRRARRRPARSCVATAGLSAMSLIYFLIVLLLSWVFYTVMTNYGQGDER